MSRAVLKRLERLERQSPSAQGQYHLMLGEVGDDDETFEARVEAFKATLPDFDEQRDTLMCVRFVSPEMVQARQEAA